MNPLQVRRCNQFWFYIGLTGVFAISTLGWWLNSSHGLDAPGERLVVLARLFGIIAALCILLEVFLMSRLPLIEENFDLHEYIDLHRLVGYGILASITAHVVFVTLGYAAPGHTALWQQFWNLNTQYEDVFKATLGSLVFFGATAISVQIIRRRMRYELWYAAHLCMYGAILLAFLHQMKTGGDFINQQWFVTYWYALYFLIFGLLAYYRFLRPVLLFAKHRFVIDRIVPEANNIYSVYVKGSDLRAFAFRPGQYATWRVLNRHLWLEGHPFSFSIEPGGDEVRFTFKSTSGDFGDRLLRHGPGSAVVIDGPRGSFTPERAETTRVVLIAGGIGVAPYLSAIKTLLSQGKDVTLLYAARSIDEVAFRNELFALQPQGLKIKGFLDSQGQRIDQSALSTIVDDNTTVYICGPDTMSIALSKALQQLRIPERRVITERFAF